MPRFKTIILECKERVVEADVIEDADAIFARMSPQDLHHVEIVASTLLMRYDDGYPDIPDDDERAVWDLPPASVFDGSHAITAGAAARRRRQQRPRSQRPQHVIASTQPALF